MKFVTRTSGLTTFAVSQFTKTVVLLIICPPTGYSVVSITTAMSMSRHAGPVHPHFGFEVMAGRINTVA
jgi:hypothetical protein